jgi:hypothetical protein
MKKETTGGLAATLGIWYQSIGAAVALVDDWTKDWSLSGPPSNAHGEGRIASGGQALELLLECFEMDGILRSEQGIVLIQFKVSSREKPDDLSKEDFNKILQNATQAILRHKTEEAAERIIGFIVASNRDKGPYFAALQEAVKDQDVDVEDPESLDSFGRKRADDIFFPNTKGDKAKKNMLAVARNVTRLKARQWGVIPDECAKACLKAMARFAFATAKPAELERRLRQWFQDWGLLRDEYGRIMHDILGDLQSPSNAGNAWTRFSMMHSVLGSTTAVPITPCSVWPEVVKELSKDPPEDPPTRTFIKPNGLLEWLLNRSALLRGLPGPYQEDLPAGVDSEEHYPRDISVQPRIIALVGDGGNGKTALMYHLFEQIARGVWDWDSQNLRSEPSFIGYPIIAAPDTSAVKVIRGALKNWGHRNDFTKNATERFAAASRCEGGEPAVWVGIDGVDEAPDRELSKLANMLANWAYSKPNLRVVLTCRREHFKLMRRGLSQKGLMRRVLVDEFSQDEAWRAIYQAVDGELQPISQSTRFTPVGRRRDSESMARTAHSGRFESAIRQPLFVGVIRRLYKNDRLDVIKSAREDNADALRSIMTEYINVFCERLSKRIKRRYISRHELLKALKHIAANVDRPQGDNLGHWKSACKRQLDGRIQGLVLYDQCIASGLIIKKEGPGSFEWRHEFIGEYLLTMD